MSKQQMPITVGAVLRHKQYYTTVHVIKERDGGYWVQDDAGGKWLLLHHWIQNWEVIA